MFTGVREDEYFQTRGRHIPELRARKPAPVLFESPRTAVAAGITEDEWVFAESPPAASRSKPASADLDVFSMLFNRR